MAHLKNFVWWVLNYKYTTHDLLGERHFAIGKSTKHFFLFLVLLIFLFSFFSFLCFLFLPCVPRCNVPAKKMHSKMLPN